MNFRYGITLAASLVLGIIFISAGIGKLIGQSAFLLELSSRFSSATLSGLIASWLPWVEIAVGLCLVAGVAVQVASLVAAGLVAAFIFHNSWMIANGYGYKPCSCLGVIEQLIEGKLSTVGSLYVDIVMMLLVLVIYFGYQGRFLNWRPWYLKRKQS